MSTRPLLVGSAGLALVAHGMPGAEAMVLWALIVLALQRRRPR